MKELTVQEAKAMLLKAEGSIGNGSSRVNPGLTHRQAWDVLYAAVMQMEKDGARVLPTRNMSKNIQKECRSKP